MDSLKGQVTPAMTGKTPHSFMFDTTQTWVQIHCIVFKYKYKYYKFSKYKYNYKYFGQDSI